MKFTVYIVSGERDGETLKEFSNEIEAIKFADDFYRKHEKELNPVFGGVAIIDENENNVQW